MERRLAFDVEGLRRKANRVAEFDDAQVIKRVLFGAAMSARQNCSTDEANAWSES